VRGTEPGEKRVARTECGCTKQQSHRDRDRPGEPDRIRSHFDRHTGEQQSCPYRHGNRDALMRYPRECSGNHADQQPPEDTAPNARATQIS